MKFFRKLGFQLVLFFVVAITIPIVMLMVSSITTTSSSMENNVKVTSEQTLNEAQNQFTTYLTSPGYRGKWSPVWHQNPPCSGTPTESPAG